MAVRGSAYLAICRHTMLYDIYFFYTRYIHCITIHRNGTYILSGAVNIRPSADTQCNMISFLTCHISFYHISVYTGMPFSMIYFMTNHKGCPKEICFTELEGNIGRLGFWTTLGLEVWTKVLGRKSCLAA